MAGQNLELKSIRVADWMTENVLAVETYDSIAIARQVMAKHRVNQLPVLDNDNLVGIVTDRDLRDAYPTSMMIDQTKAIDSFAEKVTVEEVMTHDILIVRPEMPLATAVALLRKHRIGSLPVVKNKSLVGIITRSDILDFVLDGGPKRKRLIAKAPIRQRPRKSVNSCVFRAAEVIQGERDMPSFDIVSRIDMQEVDNAVNITSKTILTRYDFRGSKTEISLDKKEKKLLVTTEDDMKMRAIQDTLIENLVKRKVDRRCLDPKTTEPAAYGMIKREIAIKDGVDSDNARAIVKLIKDKKLKVQAAMQDNQVRVTGKKIDDLQEVMQMLRGSDIPIPLQFVNMQSR